MPPVTNPTEQPTPSVSGINPPSPVAMGSDEVVTVNGSNFQAGLTVDVFNGSGSLIRSLSGSQIRCVTANSFAMLINLSSGGTSASR